MKSKFSVNFDPSLHVSLQVETAHCHILIKIYTMLKNYVVYKIYELPYKLVTYFIFTFVICNSLLYFKIRVSILGHSVYIKGRFKNLKIRKTYNFFFHIIWYKIKPVKAKLFGTGKKLHLKQVPLEAWTFFV